MNGDTYSSRGERMTGAFVIIYHEPSLMLSVYRFGALEGLLREF